MSTRQQKDMTAQPAGKATQIRQPQNSNEGVHDAGQVNIEFYTDPLCCWSWAFEKHWRALLQQHSNIQYRYVMCGMIQDWKTYSDPMNSVFKPIQMGPVWMHASEVTATKMKYSIWHDDPPTSSYPACIAVKTAGLQSSIAEEKLLFLLRKALMEDGKNISKPEVILAVAHQLDVDGFDILRFERDWLAGKGKENFKTDMKQAKYHNIGRYPTLTFSKNGGAGIMIVGYRPLEALQQAFELLM
jgi:putative protein-disulfide isomerase